MPLKRAECVYSVLRPYSKLYYLYFKKSGYMTIKSTLSENKKTKNITFFTKNITFFAKNKHKFLNIYPKIILILDLFFRRWSTSDYFGHNFGLLQKMMSILSEILLLFDKSIEMIVFI